MTNESDMSKSGRIRGRRSSMAGKSVEMKELNRGNNNSSVQSAPTGMKLAFEGLSRHQDSEMDSKPSEIP